eukprot:Nk52_evm6s1967 gene=Nk52_evmTU6s1967
MVASTENELQLSEKLYKVLVVGEIGVGKTSFIKRYVHNSFTTNYKSTIGVDFALKVINWNPNTVIRLQLWDIAGQERFGNMTRVYYKEALGAIIVFDVSRVSTFEAALKWKQDIEDKVRLPNGDPIPCVIFANKCDLAKEGLVCSAEKMNSFCSEHGFLGWCEISAKENINIDKAPRGLIKRMVEDEEALAQQGCTREAESDVLSICDMEQEENSKRLCGCGT